MPDCTLIVPTFCRPEEVVTLLTTLLRLHDEGDPVPGEMVVIDGSPDRRVESALLAWPDWSRIPFKFGYVQSAAGLTRQRNVGIDCTSGKYVFFLDDDSIPLSGYFQVVRDVFEADRLERVGAVGGAVVNEMNRSLSLRWRLRFLLGLAPNVAPMKFHPSGTSVPRALMRPFSGTVPVDVLPGCAFTFRRRALDKHRFSGFFEGYSQGEDLEIALRVGREWQVLCCGDAKILHCSAPSGRPGSFKKGYMEVVNRQFIRKRYSRPLRLRHSMRFWLDVCFLIVMGFARICRHPTQWAAIGHIAGLICGAFSSIVRPPRYEEPTSPVKSRVHWQDPQPSSVGVSG